MTGQAQVKDRDVVVDSLALSIKSKLVEPAGRQLKELDHKFNLLEEKQQIMENNLKSTDSFLETRIQELEATVKKSQKNIAFLLSTTVLSLAGVIYLLVRVS